MLGKVETPILVLAWCYISIIGLAVIIGLLFFAATSGILDFIKHQQRNLVIRHCRIYLEQNKPTGYQGCVKRALIYYDRQH